ncbi:MAG: hypothetical protein H7Z43_06140, partial [Clostridia bacterium]|nr:hypothetical protein [Deltaproteobacteria bacterium]
MKRILALMLFSLCACVIDGVPLPDQTADAPGRDTTPAGPALLDGAYVTRTAGATVVFGFEGAVAPAAVVSVTSGKVTSSTAPGENGSFNLTLGGELGSTLTVAVSVQGTVTASAILNTPVIDQTTLPSNANTVGAAPNENDTTSRVNITR